MDTFLFQIRIFYQQFMHTVSNYREVVPFTKEHQLWKGALQYSWASKIMILGGVLLSLELWGVISSLVTEAQGEGLSLHAMSNLASHAYSESYNLVVNGSYKYAILILLEVVIFHFSRKTLQALTGENTAATFQDFIKAQIRMFKVVIYSFFMEIVFSMLASAAIFLVGLSIIKSPVLFLIQCFFLGFTLVDNYNEMQNLTIKESFQVTKQYAGVALGVGIVIYFLMLIPILGTILAPILGAVTATITMHELTQSEQNRTLSIFRSKASSGTQ